MVIQRWSPPVQRQGDRLLAPFPVDLYLCIFDHFQYLPDDMSIAEYKASLISLTLVCRFFAMSFVPKLYSLFSFEGPHPARFGATKDTSQRPWLHQMVQKDDTARLLGTYVKDISYVNWRGPDDSDEWIVPPDLHLHVQALPCFRNLENLGLIRTPVSRAFFDALTAIQQLKYLRIRDCRFELVEDTLGMSADHPRLTKLEVSVCDNIGPYVSALATLGSTPVLRSLRTTHARLARAIMRLGVPLSLVQFDVPLNTRDVLALSAFLSRTPSIVDLSLSGGAEYEDGASPILLSLDGDALPALKTLRCPSYLLFQLLPRRAITLLNMVEVSDWIRPKMYTPDELTALSSWGRHIEKLEIPASLFFYSSLAQMLPALDSLCICFPFIVSSMPCHAVIRTLCGLHTRNPDIRSLRLHFFGGVNVVWSFDLKFQHRMVTDELAPAFPAATHISLTDSLEWRRDSGCWHPVVLVREYFRTLLASGDGAMWDVAQVSDVEGVFAGLFEEHEMTTELEHRLGLCKNCRDETESSEEADSECSEDV